MSAPDDTTASLDRRKLLSVDDARMTATLIVLAGRLPLGKMFRIGDGSTLIGRSTEADVWVDDDGVSRQHAKIFTEQDKITLVDLGSTNGTFCNGSKVDTKILEDGDKIQIGSSTILKFSLQDKLDEEMQRNLYESATHDGLTGIHNRRFFLETLEKEFAYCQRHQVPLSLIILDIDRFKQINDTHGHPAGDFVLARLAARVLDAIRAEDVFARYGGEEFVLLLRECRADRARMIAERLRRAVEKLDVVFNHKGFTVTVSAGMATLEGGNLSGPDEFIKCADDALYRAKANGRNRVESASDAANPAPPKP